jgi:hypothetical protein
VPTREVSLEVIVSEVVSDDNQSKELVAVKVPDEVLL